MDCKHRLYKYASGGRPAWPTARVQQMLTNPTSRTILFVLYILGFNRMNESSTDLYKMAMSAHNEGDLGKAKSYFEKAYSIDPTNGKLVYNYANLLADLNRNRKAVEKYDEAIKLDPNVPSIYYNKANCLLDLKLYKEAIEVYDIVLEIDPNYIQAQFNKAIVLTQLKQFEHAESSYLKIIQNNPEFHLAYYNLACLYALQLKVDAAFDYLKLAIKNQNKDVDYKYEAGLDDDFDKIRHLKKFQSIVN
jgi:tetratricopeptide (TPR) repeat protein